MISVVKAENKLQLSHFWSLYTQLSHTLGPKFNEYIRKNCQRVRYF